MYDRSDWDLCIVDGCINLFTDGCPGSSACPNALKRAQGVQIYVALDGDEALYVTTIAKKQ